MKSITQSLALGALLRIGCSQRKPEPTNQDPGARGQAGYLTGLVTEQEGEGLRRQAGKLSCR